jgi:glucokinase
MLLAGDVGATKTNLAVFSRETGDLLTEANFKSSLFPSLEAVVSHFLAGTGASVERAVLGVPGPVANGIANVTNLPWSVSEQVLQEALGFQEVKLLNDLEATAYGIPSLADDDLCQLNDAPPQSGTKAVLAPGTGLGEAILFFQDGHYHVAPCEGGHTDFGPRSPLELRLLQYLMAKFGHVSYERICSGIGLPNVYAFLKAKGYAKETPEMRNALRQADDQTPIIVQRAMSGECELSMAALQTFVSVLGAEAGNLALKVMATGGIYVVGGIPPRILPKLRDGTFMAAFVDKGRFADMLAHTPVYVILKAKTALHGAARYGLGRYPFKE